MSNSCVNLVLIVSPAVGWYMAVKWWGRARDRWGNKPILVLSSSAIVVSPLIWCLIRPEWAWVGLIIPVYAGFIWAGIDMAWCNSVLHFSGDGRISSYPALTSIISGAGGIAGALVAGTIGQALGSWHTQIGPLTFSSYHVLFVLGAAFQSLAVVLALRIEEPAARSTREVLRILYENASAMTRTLGYVPRRALSIPPIAYSPAWTNRLRTPATNGDGINRGVTFYGVGRLYSGQWPGRNNGIPDGVHPTNYNDYLSQLVEQAGREIAEHVREKAVRRKTSKSMVKV